MGQQARDGARCTDSTCPLNAEHGLAPGGSGDALKAVLLPSLIVRGRDRVLSPIYPPLQTSHTSSTMIIQLTLSLLALIASARYASPRLISKSTVSLMPALLLSAQSRPNAAVPPMLVTATVTPINYVSKGVTIAASAGAIGGFFAFIVVGGLIGFRRRRTKEKWVEHKQEVHAQRRSMAIDMEKRMSQINLTGGGQDTPLLGNSRPGSPTGGPSGSGRRFSAGSLNVPGGQQATSPPANSPYNQWSSYAPGPSTSTLNVRPQQFNLYDNPMPSHHNPYDHPVPSNNAPYDAYNSVGTSYPPSR